MKKDLIMTERIRYTCDSCPFFHGTSRDAELVLDRNGRIRGLAPFTYYCRPERHVCKKIAGKADYTGNQPKWCPRLEANR